MGAPARLLTITPGAGVPEVLRLPGLSSVAGLAFDRWGRFGHRLLVAGIHDGSTEVDAIDCSGRVTTVTGSAPRMEGGMEVAPPTFGPFGGDLIAADERSGAIVAVRADGTTSRVAVSGLAVGVDVGPESVGFVPPGFNRGGAAYVADHAGGTLLRLDASGLVASRVAEGDLLVVSERGGATVAIHCRADGTCSAARAIGSAGPAARVEGHLLLIASRPGTPPAQLPEASLGVAARGGWFVILPYAVGILLLAAVYLLYRRRSRALR